MGAATTTATVLIKRPARVASFVGNQFYKLVQAIAWPAAWLCDFFEISSNLVTCTRFLSPLAFLWLAFEGAPLWQYLTTVALFGYTDAVDGVLAGPKFEDKSFDSTGVILDSVADKVFIASAFVFHYPNFPMFVTMVVVGEVMIASLALGYIAVTKNGVRDMRANMWGKTKMNLELATAGLMTWFYATHEPLAENLAYVVGSLAIFFLVGSLFSKVRKVLP